VCPKILAAAKVPGSLIGKHVWDERYEDLRAVERHLARNGTAIRKFFRQVSTGEQRRFLERLNTPERSGSPGWWSPPWSSSRCSRSASATRPTPAACSPAAGKREASPYQKRNVTPTLVSNCVA
jgi:Polyphosphate kinase 2 (PPK2)